MHAYRFFAKVLKFFLLSSLIILPVFFLPVTRDFYDTNKWMLSTCLSFLVLLLWAGKLLRTGKIRVSWSYQTLGFGLMAIAAILSLTFSSFNKIEGLIAPLGPVTWITATILLFFGPSLLTEKEKIVLRLGLIILSGLAGLAVCYQQLGLATIFFPVGSPFRDSFFTPFGSTIGLLSYSLLCLPLGISIAYGAVKEKKDVIAALSFVTLILILMGAGITLWKFISLASSQLLPLPIGATLMVNSWNTLAHTLFGVGPERFFEVFTLYRPQTMNLSPVWNTAFHANASLVFHIGSTFGILGLCAFGLTLACMVKDWAGHRVTRIQVIIIIILSLFTPPTLVFIIVWIVFILSTDTHHGISEEVASLPRYVIALLVSILAVASLYGIIRWYRGEYLL
ncbi:MAG: hypothetical protein WC525_08260, partial [Candidatus Thermoplasmatota archaeon]